MRAELRRVFKRVEAKTWSRAGVLGGRAERKAERRRPETCGKQRERKGGSPEKRGQEERIC